MRSAPSGLTYLFALALFGASLPLYPETPADPIPYALSPVSALPLPGSGAVPRPSSPGSALSVLSWAGFEGAASFTFDDSQPSQLEHWPELKATGIRMTFNAIGGWARPGDELILQDIVQSGSELGNHTWSHRSIAASHAGLDLDRELDDCSYWIIHTLRQSGVWTMAYPYQRPEWREHFRGAFLLARMDSGDPVAPLSNTDPLFLPAWPAPVGTTATVIGERLDAAAASGRWTILTFHTLLPSKVVWSFPVAVKEVISGMEYGRDGGRLWLDSLVTIGTYWWAQKLFASIRPERKGGGLLWRWALPASCPPGKYLRVTVPGGRLIQNNDILPWNDHGFYEVALDAGELYWLPE